MKYLIVVGDGMCDEPVAELGGRSPLEAASTPNLDRIAREGRLGWVQTMFEGLPVESIVANMALLGYDPRRYYPHGRASFEALARGVELGPDDLAFRCNLISTKDGRISDFTAGLIPDEKAHPLLWGLDFGNLGLAYDMHPGQSYRNLLVLRGVGVSPADISLAPPHEHIGRPFEQCLCRGLTPAGRKLAALLNDLMLASIPQIERLNQTLGSKADMIWLWSPSTRPDLPNFQATQGVSGAVVCGLDFLRGIGRVAGLDAEEVPGANGYIDTRLDAKLRRAQERLGTHDLVYVHVNAPDEESRQHDVRGKVAVIERIDAELVGPLLDHLTRKNWPFRVAVLADHYTRLSDGQHLAREVPFAVMGTGIEPDDCRVYSEAEAARAASLRFVAHSLLPWLVYGRKRIPDTKTVGILGGMGPYATIDFFRTLTDLTPAEKDWEHLHVIVDCHPQIPSRTRALLYDEMSPGPAMAQTARNLVRAGAEVIAIPCNSAHAWYDEVAREVPVPVVNVIAETAAAARKAGVTRAGVLAGWVPVRTNLFVREFEKQSLAVLHPTDDMQALVVEVIESVKVNDRSAAVKAKALRVVDHLAARGADGIVAGCTEIPAVLRPEDIALPLLDTVDILARAVLREAIGQPPPGSSK